ncbi:MAG TPA: hypothetical protein VGM88_20185 [Kofleriaceae bacterium]
MTVPAGEMWGIVTDDDLQITSLSSVTRVIGCPGSLAWPPPPDETPDAYSTDFATRYANFCNATSGTLATLDIRHDTASGVDIRADVSSADSSAAHSVTVAFTGRTTIELLQCSALGDPDDCEEALGDVSSNSSLSIKAGEIYGYRAAASTGTTISMTLTTANANLINVWGLAGKEPWPPPPAQPVAITYPSYSDRMTSFNASLGGGTTDLLTVTFHAR